MRELLGFEFEKIKKSRTTQGAIIAGLIILAGILFVGYFYSQDYSIQKGNEKSGFQTDVNELIRERYSGDFTDEKVKMIFTDYLKFRQENSKDFTFTPMFYYQMGQHLFEDQIAGVSDQMISKNEQGKQLTIDEIKIKKVNSLNLKSFGKPLKIGNYSPWKNLFTVVGQVFILVNVLVILICAQIFSGDTSNNINQLLYVTRYGRSKMNAAKLIMGIKTSTLVFIGFQLLTFGIFKLLFDTSGGSSSIQTNFSIKLFDFPLEWTHWQTLFFILFLQLAGILFSASVTLLVSAISQSPMSAFSSSLGLLFLPYLLTKLFKVGPINDILRLFPLNFSDPVSTLARFSSNGFMLNSFTSNILVIFAFLIFSKTIFDLLAYSKMKNWRFA